jgi:hypothetical protein
VSERVIFLRCEWCEETFEGDEAEAAARGWFELDHEDFEAPKDYCSAACLISDL